MNSTDQPIGHIALKAPMAGGVASLGQVVSARLIGAGLVAWAIVSGIFLLPLVWDPSFPIRDDNYWAFSEWFGLDWPPTAFPHSHFGPLYPLVIHGLREIGVSIYGVIVLQKLLLLVCAWLIFRIARNAGLRASTAAVAGFAFTVYPIVQIHSSLLFSETLYLTLLLGGLDLLLRAARAGRSARFSTLSGGFILIGLAALARGNGLVFFAVLGLLLIFRCDWKKTLIAGVIGALPILGWSGLNYHWYGHFKPTSSGDANIAASIVGPVMARLEGLPQRTGPEVWISGNWYDHYPNLFAFSKAMRDKAIDYAIDHPVPIVLGNAKGWLNTLVGPAASDLLEAFGTPGYLVVGLSMAIRCLLLFGMLAFFLTGSWRRYPLITLALAIAVLAHVIAGGAAGFGRFGYPVDAISTIVLLLTVQARRSAGRDEAVSASRSPRPSASA